MAISTLDQYVSIMSGGGNSSPQIIHFFKDARISTGSTSVPTTGRGHSFWDVAGFPLSSAGTTPTSGSQINYTNLSSGSLGQTNPVSAKNWLVGVNLCTAFPGTFLFYDRICGYFGCSGTSTAEQAVSMSAFPRYSGSTTSIGNFIAIEIFSPIGASNVVFNVKYKNELGVVSTSQSSSIGGVGLDEAQRFILVSLAPGDKGVTEVDSVRLSGTTATAGNFGVIVGHPLAYVPVTVNTAGSTRDNVMGLPSLPQVEANAAIGIVCFGQGNGNSQAFGNVIIAEG